MAIGPQTKGVYTIAPTPFEPDGKIDWISIDSMVEFYERCGVDGMTILGIMGEAPKLDATEALDIVKRVVGKTNMPIIVGVSAPGFAAMRSLARASMEAGAQAVMIAPPPSLRTDEQIVTYFRNASEAIGEDVPFVLQDYPLTLSVVMTPAVIRRIVQENPACFMLKHEDWPGLEKITSLRKLEEEGSMRPISILCGNGGLFLDFEMERGADGAMTGYAFPDMLVETVRLSASGERDKAHDLFDAHLPYLRYEQQQGVGLAARKYVMMKRGAIKHDAQRRPGAALSEKARSEVDYLLNRLERQLS